MYDYSFALSLFDARNYVSNVAINGSLVFELKKLFFIFFFQNASLYLLKEERYLELFIILHLVSIFELYQI